MKTNAYEILPRDPSGYETAGIRSILLNVTYVEYDKNDHVTLCRHICRVLVTVGDCKKLYESIDESVTALETHIIETMLSFNVEGIGDD